MKFSDVRNLMERNRALTEFCSLPVVIMKDGEKTVTWFNFSLGKSEEQLCAKVREILDTRDGKELNRTKSEISVPVDKDKTSVPEISQKEYYQELEKIGLAAPQVTYIMHDLKEKGLPVKVNVTTVEEAADEIMQALEKKI